jgi:hypothetical protein
MRNAPKPNGLILYRGPSKLDGKPIVVVAVGLADRSTNTKTGGMIQTYILADQGLKPSEATKADQDSSVCGLCPAKGKGGKGRTCYVNLGQGPRAVYDKLYSAKPYDKYDKRKASHRALFKGRRLRFGTYGDPAAVPMPVWKPFLSIVSGWTGYTHHDSISPRHVDRLLKGGISVHTRAGTG